MTHRSQPTSLGGRLVPLPAMRRGDRAARLLSELQQAHVCLLDSLSLKEAVTGASPPVSTRHSLVRWQLGRARHSRQRILNDVYAELFRDATAEEAAMLRLLQADELDLCRRSSDHLARWTNERIEADWSGFRSAAAEFIARVRRRVMTERETIYPMLVARTDSSAHIPRATEIREPWASTAVS